MFLQMRNQSHTLVWEGAGGEALRRRTGADLPVVSGKADQLRQAASIAREGAGTIGAVQRRVIYAVEDAHHAGFIVGDDLSVTDTRTSRSAAEQAARQAQAHAFAGDIRQRAAHLIAVEHDVAARITAATVGLATTTFPATLHDHQPHIQAVDHHWKQEPGSGDPARTPGEVRAAYDQLKSEIRDHNAWRPALNDAGAVNAYNREADALNARKAALEGQLGKTETVPAQGTRLVPDWAYPAPEQPPAHRAPPGAALDITTPHARDLGTDPGIGGGFRPGEAETGLRIEAQRGITLQRSPHPGADWIDPVTGAAYDAVGNFDGRYLNMEEFLNKIDDHIYKAQFVPVDVSQFSAEQRTIIRRFIAGLGKPNVFIVGDY